MNRASWISLFLLTVAALPAARAQTSPMKTSPTPAATLAPAGEQASDDAGEDDAPFHSFWENNLQLGSTNQQQGQSTGFFGYTGTLHLTEGGHFLSAGLQTNRQKVEGVGASTATLNLGGGLGLGFFSPSLTLGLGGGDKGWKQFSGNLNLGFQLWEPFALMLSSGGTLGSHTAPIMDIFPSSTNPDDLTINTNSVITSIGFIFIPWDWFSIYPSVSYQNDGSSLTYKNVNISLDQSDQIATLTLTLDLTLFKGFVLELAPQGGREYFPAGYTYSPETGGIVHNASASTQNFVGGTTSISYSFE